MNPGSMARRPPRNPVDEPDSQHSSGILNTNPQRVTAMAARVRSDSATAPASVAIMAALMAVLVPAIRWRHRPGHVSDRRARALPSSPCLSSSAGRRWGGNCLSGSSGPSTAGNFCNPPTTPTSAHVFAPADRTRVLLLIPGFRDIVYPSLPI
jgi:hypothetical protein